MGRRKPPSALNRLVSRGTVVGLKALELVLRACPYPMWGWLSTGLSYPLWIILRRYRHVALENLAASGYGPTEARRIGRASFAAQFMVFIESMCLPRIFARGAPTVEFDIDPEAAVVLEEIRAGKHPTIVGLGGHAGSWEVAGAAVSRLIAPADHIVSSRIIRNPILWAWAQSLRTRMDITALDKDLTVRHAVERRREGRPTFYSFMCDQHFKRGLKLPFVDRPACTVSLPANMIHKYDCATIIGHCHRVKPGHYHFWIGTLDPATYRGLPREEAHRVITLAVNDLVTAAIRKAPEQWTWGHRRWRDCCARVE